MGKPVNTYCEHCKKVQRVIFPRDHAPICLKCKNTLKTQKEPVAKLHCSDGLLLRLLEEMRTETVECLWDHANAEDLDKQTCESMTSRLEDFFNQKIYDIKRKQ